VIEERPVITPPFPRLTAAAFGLGHNFLALDDDGVARRIVPFVRKGDRYLPSLGIAAALVAGGFRPDEVMLDGNAIRVRDRRIPLVAISASDPNSRVSREQWTTDRRGFEEHHGCERQRSEGEGREGSRTEAPIGELVSW
jgi:hypothetical protein